MTGVTLLASGDVDPEPWQQQMVEIQPVRLTHVIAVDVIVAEVLIQMGEET